MTDETVADNAHGDTSAPDVDTADTRSDLLTTHTRISYLQPGTRDGLPAYDYTALNEINRCPTLGILRYAHHRVMQSGGRATALECGRACHDVFAARRLWHVMRQDNPLPVHMRMPVLHRLFGTERGTKMHEAVHAAPANERARMLAMCMTALHTAGYEDDPRDRRRTLVNIERACLAYCDKWTTSEPHPVWWDEPTGVVGVELPFELLVETPNYAFRYVGRVDGLHLHSERGELFVGENKTTSRITDAWQAAFTTSHQITGYCVAASLLARQQVTLCRVHGLEIPLPVNNDFGGVVSSFVSRREEPQVLQWMRWIEYTIEQQLVPYIESPTRAPMHTHACNAFFRPCQFIPFCASDDDDRAEMIAEMQIEKWSPLRDKL